MIRKLILTTILTLAFAVPGWAATYYMQNGGTAANHAAASGPCGTQANCIDFDEHEADGGSLSDGDIITLCDDGGVYRDGITPPTAGTSAGITYIGTTGDTPIISGADILATWADEGGGVWSKAGITTEPRIVTYDGTRLAKSYMLPAAPAEDTFDETLEAAGYVTAFTESGSPDENANVTAVGSPEGWGAQCLEVDAPDNTDWRAIKTYGAGMAINYIRKEVIFTEFDLFTNINDMNITLRAFDTSFATVYTVNVRRGAYGQMYWSISANDDGGGVNTYDGFYSVVLNRRYTIEVKFDATNNLWGWKINGVPQPNDQDSTFPVGSDGALTATHPTDIKYHNVGAIAGGATYKGYRAYFDNIAVDDSEWVGESLGVLRTNEFYWAADTLYINVGEDPAGGTVEAGQRDYPVVIDGKDYINLQDFTIQNANHSSLYINDAATLIMTDLVLDGGGYQGTYTPGAASSDPVTFTRVTAHGFGSSGINIAADADYWGNVTLDECTAYDNGWAYFADTWALLHGDSAGIKVWGGKNLGAAGESDDLLIQKCKVYDNYDWFGNLTGSGIWVDQWGDNAIVRYNLIYDNDGPGLIFENMDGGIGRGNLIYGNNNGLFVYRDITTHKIYNNTVYNNLNWGIAVFGGAAETDVDSNDVRNNISVGNGSHQLHADLGGDNTGDGTGNVYNSNCFGAEGTNFILWDDGGADDPDTYDEFIAASSQTDNNVESDPSMTDPANDDFTLPFNSSCVDAGVFIAGYNIVLSPASVWTGSVVTGDQNSFGRGAEIGAFYFPQSNPLPVKNLAIFGFY